MNDKHEKILEMFEDLKELLCKDIKSVIAKGDITPPDYQQLDTAVDIFKDVTTICAMLESEHYGTSGGYSGNSYGNSYAQGGGGNSGYMPRYDHYTDSFISNDGYSQARGRSPMTGRYISRDDEMNAKLSNMMATANTEQERQIIGRMMNEMGR